MPSNAELHGLMDQAISAGDLDRASKYIADDVINHIPGEGPFAGDVLGREAFFELLGQALGDGQVSVEHRSVLENDEYSAALGTMSASREGKTFRGDVVDLCRWQDGRVVEEWVMPFDVKAWDAFWS